MGTSESIKYSGREREYIIQDLFLPLLSFMLFHLHLLHKERIIIFHFVTFLMWVILLSLAIDSGYE